MSPFIWGLIMITFIFFEAVTYALVSIWFVGGALLALIASLLGFSLATQLIVFIVSSVFLVVLSRKLTRDKNDNLKDINSFIGEIGIVTKAYSPHSLGQGKMKGQIWTISSSDNETLEVGEEFIVKKVEGVKLIVKRRS